MSYVIGNSHPDSLGGCFYFGGALVTNAITNKRKKLVVIDNYDSFTYNLVQMFMTFDLAIEVYRSDTIDVSQVMARNPDYLLISPGPKDPPAAGISMALIQRCHRKIPILGVCLGMQCINEVFGGRTVRCQTPMHGKTSRIRHDHNGVFKGVPSPFTAARYHSLMVQPAPTALSTELMITADTHEGVIMGISHRRYPLHGVQFHPESFLTEHGFTLVENFLKCNAASTAIDKKSTQIPPPAPPEMPRRQACG